MTIKILLVDDNRVFMAAVRKFLDVLPGTSVMGEAHDGREALIKAEELQPDLILLDIAMPLMNGMEVARRIQTWLQPPKIVFLSMHDSVAYQEAASSLGALGVVGKSDFVTELLPILEGLVTSSIPPGAMPMAAP
jgi:DNA-binding NarL/FixJ family response regulator